MKEVRRLNGRYDIDVPTTRLEQIHRALGFRRGWKRHECMVCPPCWLRESAPTEGETDG